MGNGYACKGWAVGGKDGGVWVELSELICVPCHVGSNLQGKHLLLWYKLFPYRAELFFIGAFIQEVTKVVPL